MREMKLVHVVLVLLLAVCIVASPPPPDSSDTAEYDVSILIPVHKAPSVVQRMAWASLEALMASKQSKLKIEVLWTRISDGEDFAEAVRDEATAAVHPLFKFIPPRHQPSDSISAAFNRLADAATGKYLYLISDSIFVEPNMDLGVLIKPLEDPDRRIGVTTNQVLFDDSTVASSGYTFLMAKNPNKHSSSTSWSDASWRGAASRSGQYSSWRNRNSRWSGAGTSQEESNSASTPELHKLKTDVPVLHFANAGFLSTDSRVTTDRLVVAAPFLSFMISRALFSSVSGFNASAYPNAYFDADLCLRLQTSLNFSSLYVASSHVVLLTIDEDYGVDSEWAVDNYNSEFIKPSLAKFTDAWHQHVSQLLDSALTLKNLTLVWAMDCGAGQVLGFTTEATNILSSIHLSVRTKVIVSNSAECKQELRKIGFPISTRKLLRILEERDDRHDNEHLVAVLHKDPGRYSFSIFQEPFRSASYLVGRSMYETTSIPAAWVQPCNTEVDAIWVPTEFNRATFASSGVNSSLLAVVPEAIDLHHFDPSIVRGAEFPSKKLFSFLSISKWEKRKGWDILLTAYFDVFKATDPVVLTFRSNMNAENTKQFAEFTQRYASSHNVSVQALPRVQFIKSIVPYGMLPVIYKTADAFVLASHGEGWGLPLMEAMSMELPTIATNWSGNTAFMTAENSYLIDVESMAAVDGEQGHSWAVPAVRRLGTVMRSIFDDKTKAAEKGKQARRDLLSSQHLNAIRTILGILESVQPHLDDFKRARESKADQNMWSNTFQYSSTNGGGAASNGGWSGWSGSSTQQTFVDASGRTRMRVKINQ
eukprot:TRINITY_DN1701_c0_g1_i1.p1 TRINITY_DN1701_c0_g1~~TRINITY_DN1701_c0_g1_i1.p1  ORF type:complete len:819 (+),score=84.39 TRINITY_DN1701_c0_g1_i1:17-2473(+)